ncbi:MAG: zf-HC2 domain-containing protein [Acidobacteria bacterium]|nr:zf-HC2 domain-containing protein [Acidobacteriota bacterium]
MNAALNVRDYACAKVRRRLDSYLAGELSVDLSHEILEHLDRCPACARELKARENLRGAVRRIAALAPEPREGFEAEVRARVARTPAPSAGTATSLLLAASLIVAAGAGTLFLLSRVAGTPEANLAAARDAKAFLFAALNHKNCTLRGSWDKAPAAAPAALGKALDPDVRAVVEKVAGDLPGYSPIVAHDCGHAGERILHVIFRRTGSSAADDLVSVVATRPGSTLASSVKLAGLVSGGHRDGLSVVGTSAGDGRLVFLVTSGSDADAMRLGKLVLPTLATAFVVR